MGLAKYLGIKKVSLMLPLPKGLTLVTVPVPLN
jgi:hypothetical protein